MQQQRRWSIKNIYVNTQYKNMQFEEQPDYSLTYFNIKIWIYIFMVREYIQDISFNLEAPECQKGWNSTGAL